jgi:hypothetical protein
MQFRECSIEIGDKRRGREIFSINNQRAGELQNKLKRN